MSYRRLIVGLSALLLCLAPASAADRKPIVLGASGQQQQIQSGDTLSVPAAKVTGISGSTQCVQASTAGLLSGTGASCPTGANPTATASDAAVNGSAATFMRSDGAPAVQKGSSSAFGVVKVDGTTITASSGVISAAGGGGTTTNALTITNTGGASPGATFNGSAAKTIDYSTVGAAKTGAITSSNLTMGTGKLLGRTTASTGAVEEISVGSGLTFTGGTIAAGPGTGSGAWGHITTFTWSTNVAQVDIAGLAGYSEIYVIVRNMTLSVSGVRQFRLSTDNGATFFSGAGDYVSTATIGTEVGQTSFGIHGTSATAARTGSFHIIGANLSGFIKPIELPNFGGTAMFVGSTDPVNAFRIFPSAGGNITGGTIDVWAR